MTTHPKRGRRIVWTVALCAATLLGVVIVLTQVGFYRDNLSDSTPVDALPWLNLAFLTPIAVEGVAWVFTVFTAFAVINNRPSGRYERLMWLFSCVNAGVNAWHNMLRGDVLTGIVLGGMSIAGPLIVHMVLRWDREVQADRTAEEIRRAAIDRTVRVARRTAQVTRHPIYSWRTVSIATNLDCGWNTAYRIALLGQYTTVKGLLREQFEQSLPGANKPALDASRKADDKAIEQDIGESLFPPCKDPLIEDLQALQNPGDMLAVWGLHDAVQEDRASQESSNNELAQHDPNGLHDDTVQDDECKTNGLAEQDGETLHNKPLQDPECKNTGLAQQADDGLHNKPDEAVHDDAVQDDEPLATPRKSTPRKPRSKRVVQAKAERQEHVAARYWHDCMKAGENPRRKPGVEIARDLGISPSAVSRGYRWAEEGFDPDKPGEA